MYRSKHARNFYAFVSKEGAAKYDMNIAYSAFKKELESTPDRSVVYICDESGGTISRVCFQTLQTYWLLIRFATSVFVWRSLLRNK